MPNSFWTLDRLAEALRERASVPSPVGTQPILGISTDTRTITAGHCFVALTGGRYDGHEFLNQAVAAGATALVLQRGLQLHSFDVPIYIVDDTLVALGDLARYWRTAWGELVVGIAGSNGKTSTKELLRAALQSVYTVHATTGNLNNRIGVPLTLLAMSPEAECAVVEIGTSLPGEVSMLRTIARPDVAIVTCIAEEHLEGLGDLNGVLREESTIFDNTEIAITPSSQPEIAAAAMGRAKQVIQAGLDAGDVHADSWSIAPDGSGTIVLDGISVRPPVRGAHNLRNTMLALAAARVCGVSIEAASLGIQSMAVPPMRTAWQSIGSATILNDAYNANPGSARAALEMLAAARTSQRVAILGSMRELGPNAAQYHDDVARTAIASSADIIAGIGEFSAALRRVAPNDARVVTAQDVDELWPLLISRLLPDATILLKASRGVKLERILSNITNWATH